MKAKKVGKPAPFLKSLFKGVGKLFGVDTDAMKAQAKQQADALAAQAEATRFQQAMQAQAVRMQQEQQRQRDAIAARAAEALAVQPGVSQADVQVGTSGAEATASRQRRKQFFAPSNTGIRI